MDKGNSVVTPEAADDSPTQKLIREMYRRATPPLSGNSEVDQFARVLYALFRRTVQHRLAAAEGLATLNKMTQLCVAAHDGASAIDAMDRAQCLTTIPNIYGNNLPDDAPAGLRVILHPEKESTNG